MKFLVRKSGVTALSIKVFATGVQDKIERAVKGKKHEMQMAFVKSQLAPQLLFKMTNNIDALVLKDAFKASAI
ncbi:hypothetical protein [Mucilaginibacter psychrotolerans]|uniref:hypothetical protein n=1 Tax=Mucilaginibacter psychrotolerans TaxID=1524096 RepID=UPI0018650ABD|nr:hypothetical protein [Mucilaginibacter psychrotolerans]